MYLLLSTKNFFSEMWFNFNMTLSTYFCWDQSQLGDIVELPAMATSLQQPLDSPYIYSYFNISTTATSLPQQQH